MNHDHFSSNSMVFVLILMTHVVGDRDDLFPLYTDSRRFATRAEAETAAAVFRNDGWDTLILEYDLGSVQRAAQ